MLCIALIGGLTALRVIFAVVVPLRVDEAYYWTWSKESVLSFLDHPPMVSWFVYAGTLLFGDTNLGVRFSGPVVMLIMQALLADIVWRTTRDWRYVILAVLLPEAAPDYGLLITKVTPDIGLIAFSLAMVWALVRQALSGNPKWWLLAGLFGGLALTAKYTAILLLPAVFAYVLVPSWRNEQLKSPYLWSAVVLAVLVFSPVFYWNALHDWQSFRFQLNRPIQTSGWSLKFTGEFLGNQFILLGVLLFPMVLIGTARFGWRGFRDRDPVAILLSMCVAVPLTFMIRQSLFLRIGDSWPLFIWPFGFACAAINLKRWRQEAGDAWLPRIGPAVATVALVTGIGFTLAATAYYVAAQANYLKNNDPIGKEAGFADVAVAADHKLRAIQATWFATTDYRIYSMLRWNLKDRVPVIQINERSRFIGFHHPAAELSGTGLYIFSVRDPVSDAVWDNTTAVLESVGQVELVWRGFRYDTYRMKKLENWTPVLSPSAGDPLFISRPH